MNWKTKKEEEEQKEEEAERKGEEVLESESSNFFAFSLGREQSVACSANERSAFSVRFDSILVPRIVTRCPP